MKKRLLFIGMAAIVLIAALFGVVLFKGNPQTFTGFAMGSVLNGTLWATGLPYPGLSSDFTQLVQDMEAELISLKMPPQEVLLVAEASNGAFDPCLGALVKLWDINNEPYLPTQEEIDLALEKSEVDLGAYGKGAACDEMLKQIKNMSVKAAVINLGGNILTYGRKPWGKPFKIALRDPNGGPNDAIGTFTLRGAYFISTSGSYEKFFEQDGKRYHHIFDPLTGYPAEREPGLVSVTVITREDRREVGRSANAGVAEGSPAGGALGDMISTACFVLGYEASLDLLEQYGCDALFIYESGETRPVGNVMEYWSQA